MTKENESGRTLLSIFYRSPRLMQGLSLMGSFGLLSSGFVIAQTDSFIDTGIAPSASPVESAPALEPPAARKPVASEPKPIVVPIQRARKTTPERVAPERPPAPAAARKPVAPQAPSAPAAARKPVAPEAPSAPAAAQKPVVRVRRASQTAERKPLVRSRQVSEASLLKPIAPRRVQEAAKPIITVEKKSPLAAPDLSIPNSSTVAKPPKLYLNPAQAQESAKVPVGLTNSYIDRTDYSIGATRRADSPSVVLTERSTGCSAVLRNGQLSSGICGTAAPIQQTATRQINSSQLIAARQIGSQLTATRYAVGQLAPSRYVVGQLTAARPIVSQQVVSPQADMADQPLDVPSLPNAISSRIVQEPHLAGVTRVPMLKVAAAEPVKLGTTKWRFKGNRAPQPRTYSTYSTERLVASAGRILYSADRADGSLASAYYNLTSRPEGRQNVEKANFMFPLAIPAAISSVFGWRIHPITGEYRFHAGTDLAAPEGTPVLAAVAGEVVTADFLGGYGLSVILQHPDRLNETLYAHLSEIFVRPGDLVEQGTVIGRVGSTGNSTGPHLHFEWRHRSADGWVALDAGANVEYALAQFVQVLQVAQATPQPAPQRGF